MLEGQGTLVQDENPSDVWTVNAPHTRGDSAITDMDAHNKNAVINATPVPDNTGGGGSRAGADSTRRMKCLAVLVSLVALFLVALLVPLLRERNTRNKDRIINITARPTSPPTMPPTSARFSEIVNEILTHFESPTLEEDLRTPNSPQYRAALWMAEEDEHPATVSLSYPLNQTDLEVFQFRQRYAVVTLFYATGGEGWWRDPCMFLTPTRHVCEWRCPLDLTRLGGPSQISPGRYGRDSMGVTCGNQLNDSAPVFDDLVLAVEIYGNGLIQTIPDEIQGLDVLEVLYLEVSQLTGPIPFEALANTLTVKRPILGQQIGMSQADDPSSLGIAPSLRRLSVTSSSLTGQVLEQPFLYNLTALELLDLNNNLFSGTIPSALGELTALTHLNVGWNFFTGTVMEQPFLYNLNAFEFIALNDNLFSGTIASTLGELTALTHLNVGWNNFTGTVMEQPFRDDLTSLEYLALDGNLFTGTIPSALGELTALSHLSVGWNIFTGKVMEQPFLYNLTTLEYLAMYSNLFSGTIALALGELTALTYLDLSGNELTGSLPTEIGNLGGSLISLYLQYNDLSGTFPTELGMLTNLDFLGLNGNGLLSGSLEPFCTTNPVPNVGWQEYRSDCNLDNVTCSCCCCFEFNGTNCVVWS